MVSGALMATVQFIPTEWVARAAWNVGLVVYSHSIEVEKRPEHTVTLAEKLLAEILER